MSVLLGKNKDLFDVKDLDVKFLTPLPLDMTIGLSKNTDYLSIEKETPEIFVHKGISGETCISENGDSVHKLTLTYLPNSICNTELNTIKMLGTPFGVYISNGSTPKYKGIATEARILKKPAKRFNSDGGVQDLTWEVIMLDYKEVH